MELPMAARPPRQSCFGALSAEGCEAVFARVVAIKPLLMPQAACPAGTAGAKPSVVLVAGEALAGDGEAAVEGGLSWIPAVKLPMVGWRG
eukprot:1807807-Lingulodinium_polyedra.AAC.1